MASSQTQARTAPELSLTRTERVLDHGTRTLAHSNGAHVLDHDTHYLPSDAPHRPPIDLTRPQRAAVDERGVSLHEGSASGQALPHIGGSLHPAHRDHAQRGGRVRPGDPRNPQSPSPPPTEITHSEAGVCCRMTRSTASARAASGAPESPPAPSCATSAAGVCKPSRERVEFVAMMPSSLSCTTSSQI